MDIVNFSQAGAAAQPSPSIWADCPTIELNHQGRGVYIHEDFTGGAVSAAVTAAITVGKGELAFDGDTDTVFTKKAAEVTGYLDIETDGDDNDAAAIFTNPLGSIVRNSGNKVWFEARFEIGAVADQGVFLGLVEAAGSSRDVIADNCAALIGESLFGFQIVNGDTDAFDAVAQNNATQTVVKADANLSTALGSGAANLAADTERKVGLRFDGKETVEYYVDGVKVAVHTLTSSNTPSQTLGAIVAIKTGTAAAQSMAIDWVRVAFQNR